MIAYLQDLLSNWTTWIGGILGLSAILSWIPGGGAVVGILTAGLRMLASAFEVISPVLSAILQGILYIWREILLPTLIDIFDNVRTIIGISIIVSLVVMSTMFYMRGNDDIKYSNLQNKYNACQSELRSINRPMPQVDEQPLFNPFSIFKLW